MRDLLKAYMLVIYKLTGDCKVDHFYDINSYKDLDVDELSKIEAEILTETSNHKELIFKHTKVEGSLDKELLKADLLKNGFYRQLRHEGII